MKANWFRVFFATLQVCLCLIFLDCGKKRTKTAGVVGNRTTTNPSDYPGSDPETYARYCNFTSECIPLTDKHGSVSIPNIRVDADGIGIDALAENTIILNSGEMSHKYEGGYLVNPLRQGLSVEIVLNVTVNFNLGSETEFLILLEVRGRRFYLTSRYFSTQVNGASIVATIIVPLAPFRIARVTGISNFNAFTSAVGAAGFENGDAYKTFLGQENLVTTATASVNTWKATTLTNAPTARGGHSAVWTGTQMIIWGGYDANDVLKYGARYDPALDRWTPTSLIDAPDGRSDHTAIWTGTKMIVFGGINGGKLDSGGIYDPLLDTWMETDLANAPTVRSNNSAIWTGSKMIVFGGVGNGGAILNSGGIFDPLLNTWMSEGTPITNAPVERVWHTAVWTGAKMIIYGGYGQGVSPFLNTGGVYDPLQNTWLLDGTSLTGAPEGRTDHVAVWTGSRMVVYGGENGSNPYLRSGGRYDPETNSWIATTTTGAPQDRSSQKAVWTGFEMIVWGGVHSNFENYMDTYGRYNPLSDSWLPITAIDAPTTERVHHTAVWTGSQMIVWGGQNPEGTVFFNSGGIYTP